MLKRNAGRLVMRKTMWIVLLVLAFICACSDNKEQVRELLGKEKALWNEGRYTDPQKAIEYLDQLIKLEPDNPKHFIKRGTAYYNLGQFQKAIDNYTQSIHLLPDNVVGYQNRGNAYANLRQFAQAVEDYNQVIRLQPKFVEAYKNRGIVYLNQGNKKSGCEDLQKACSLGDCNLLNAAKNQHLCD